MTLPLNAVKSKGVTCVAATAIAACTPSLRQIKLITTSTSSLCLTTYLFLLAFFVARWFVSFVNLILKQTRLPCHLLWNELQFLLCRNVHKKKAESRWE